MEGYELESSGINWGDGDKEATGDEGVESCDKRGEEIIGDDGIGSAIMGEAGAVQWMDKGVTGVLDLIKEEISSIEKVEEDGHG